MKILFITYYYPPETGAGSIRTEELVRQWQRKGHEITVVTGYPNYPSYEIYKGYKNRLISRENCDGINLIRTFTYVRKDGNILGRALGQVLFMTSSILGGLFASRPDIIVASSPPFTIGFSTIVLSIIKRAPFIFDVRDPYPLVPIELGVIKSRTLIALLSAIERLYYKLSARVVTVTESFRNHIVRKISSPKKCKVIPNGVNIDYFKKSENIDRKAIADKLGIANKLNIAYVGTLGRVHDLNILVKAATRFTDNPDIQFIIAGHGVKRKELVESVERYGLKNFVIMDPLPKKSVRELLHITDIGFQGLDNIEYIAGAHAVKLFEYMAMKVPIVFSGAGESRKLIEDAQAGICSDTNNLEGVVEAIRILIDSPELRAQYGQSGRSHVETHYDRKLLADKYLGMLNQVLNNK